MKTDEKNLLKKKRIAAVCSAIAVVGILGFFTWFLGSEFNTIASSGVEFRDYIQSYGNYGIIVAVGIQILQVVIALIPGEFVEIGIGYAYGWFWGTILCLTGVAAGSSLIFLLVKRFGIKFVEIFVSSDKINEHKFINSEKKLKRITFILFFIPGTPKDLLTFFVGLTRMTLGEFLTITLFARIPSVVSSTLGGSFIGDGKYIMAVVVFAVTASVSLGGLKLYTCLVSNLRKKAENNKYFNKIIHYKDDKKYK